MPRILVLGIESALPGKAPVNTLSKGQVVETHGASIQSRVVRQHGLFLCDSACLEVFDKGGCSFDERLSVHTVNERKTRDNGMTVVAGFHDNGAGIMRKVPPEIGNALAVRGNFSFLQDGLLVL